MKKIILYTTLLLSVAAMSGCKKDSYPGGEISPFIALYDLRNIYRGKDVTLTKENMLGSTTITGMVVSDHSGGNLPEGILVVQDKRRLDQLRGIAIPIGAEAASYKPGDSVVISVEGKTLSRVDGMLQLKGVEPASIKKVSSDNPYLAMVVQANRILDNPDQYECILAAIVEGGFDPLPSPGEKLSGDKLVNDGYGNITLHTEAKSEIAGVDAPVLANFYVIPFNKLDGESKLVPQLRMRTKKDLDLLSSVIEIPAVVITGIMSDADGGDGNYEYVQLMATKDIDFSVTPFSVVTTNNAGASAPGGYPANGWATGTQRTYKINLNSGTAKKGTFFYAGGTGKKINGSASTSISTSNWVKAYDYVAKDGEGFGSKTGGWLANSGNACGVAVFDGTTVTVNTKPVDALFISSGGSLYTPTPTPQGYRIPNNDWYRIKHPITKVEQPYYRQGSNTQFLPYPAGQGYFYLLGGEYNLKLGRWTKARTTSTILLSRTSVLTDIEGEGSFRIKE
ncbi:DUF5689 domain-containing protein [Paraflavitalea sp. CAU 1676]|uniref:DUF5689 domain-containing protein n=1 Tax=Paraflavitalea sp. CAU 1676 TaxID=3032598 RepID=UPI0023DC480C|nr:DUF5689 domain-containing protein [Paraflavitalea sp. CAU 1676]MDF2192295.1 DUF5689 domain-containing protein [Paraflavitalea sp. CAU 1676]